MTSIRKVSRVAGVSVATVSRTMRHPDQVKEETRKKVLDAVEAVGYRPNMMSRNFRAKKSFAILVLVPNIANPFFSRVIRGIEHVAQQKGYAVLLGDTQGLMEREHEYVSLVTSRQADGIIQLSPNIAGILDAIGSVETPVPIVNACECSNDALCPTVRIDNQGAARLAVQHLVDSGHKRIGVILGPKESPLTRDRLVGYKHVLNENNISFEAELTVSGDFTLASGGRAVAILQDLKKPPTAIFCCNDEMAMGAMHQIKKTGKFVPGDISIVGFDDIEFVTYTDPPLTTIAQPAEELGEVAFSVLLDLLEGRVPEKQDYVLPSQLIVRESTAARE
ncbi:MAG: LacI family repressor for deo operon, udp, cdd, tsx, nupC, and nupG [Flavobacteriales bacterium]|jgi:LacI family repressor for deo operon, udp, cdd, tsx, nupC, and nupG